MLRQQHLQQEQQPPQQQHWWHPMQQQNGRKCRLQSSCRCRRLLRFCGERSWCGYTSGLWSQALAAAAATNMQTGTAAKVGAVGTKPAQAPGCLVNFLRLHHPVTCNGQPAGTSLPAAQQGAACRALQGQGQRQQRGQGRGGGSCCCRCTWRWLLLRLWCSSWACSTARGGGCHPWRPSTS
ncbi:hypothetical protein COO60DRAFT_1488041 [Scenedesmus sp. NREL 46B-D3]|nr:hypothetical protein COO60DRAFT_1488041 [Scenedesmus sp. NREL 46B-D3]